MTNTANIERRQAVSQPVTFAPASVIPTTFNSQRVTHVALNSSRGSGAVRGNVSVIEAHGENRERNFGSGHSETENGELLVENYVEAELQYVTLKVWRPVKWVTGGGRLQAPLPPFSQKAREEESSRSNTARRFSEVLVNQFKTRRHGDAVSDSSRGSGAVRGNGAKVRPAEITVQRRIDGHSETEQGELSAENCLEADLRYVTLKVCRPVKRVTDGGRLQALLPPFSQKVGDAKSSHSNRAVGFSEGPVNQFKPLRDGHAVLDISRGSGAERGSVRSATAHGENRERDYGSGHSETENGELLVENYVEAELQYVTLEVRRPVKWVTDGGRLQALSPPTFSTQEA
jgi:hypothetical protein